MTRRPDYVVIWFGRQSWRLGSEMFDQSATFFQWWVQTGGRR